MCVYNKSQGADSVGRERATRHRALPGQSKTAKRAKTCKHGVDSPVGRKLVTLFGGNGGIGKRFDFPPFIKTPRVVFYREALRPRSASKRPWRTPFPVSEPRTPAPRRHSSLNHNPTPVKPLLASPPPRLPTRGSHVSNKCSPGSDCSPLCFLVTPLKSTL